MTYLIRHISRSLKKGDRWCLVFHRDQLVPARSLPHVSTIVETPSSEEALPQMKWEEPGPCTSTDNISEASSKDSGALLWIVVDKPMSEASLLAKKVREPEKRMQMKLRIKRKKRKTMTQNINA